MKLNKKVLAIVSIGALMGAFSQAASAREFADIYTECGLGAIIAPNNGVVAAVTNVTWDLGTTAVSTNISSPESCAGGKKKTAALLIQNYAQIERDLARGKGEHLAAVMVAAGCSATSQEAVATSLRNGLQARASKADFATATRLDRAKAVYNDLGAAGTCTI